jgi:signal transduction histidine kinase/DNA-binding response OmpR family regulator
MKHQCASMCHLVPIKNMTGRPDKKILWGLSLAIVAIAGMGGIFYCGTSLLIADAQRVDSTHSVINTLSDFYSQVQDIRMTTRGYVLNGNERFITYHNAAMSRAQKELQSLEPLAQDNPEQAKNLQQLKKLFQAKLNDSDQLIKMRKRIGLLPAVALIRQQMERDLNDDLRQLVERMSNDQREQLAHRGLEAQNSSRAMLVVVVAGSLAEIIVALAAALAIRRHIRERQAALDALRQSESILRKHAAELSAAKDALESNSRQLELARVAADAANQSKSTFLANMSHEIRTPVTAIVGYAELVLEPDQTASDRHDCLQIIRRSARHLLELINEILDLSKIEAGRMTVESIPCNPAQLVSEVVSMVRPRAEEKSVAMHLEFVGAFPDQIKSDPLRLRQVLMNLVGNAVKFTNTGEIKVNAECSRDDAGHSVLKVAVADTGIGMSPQQLQRCFHPFTQADETTTRKFGGTGLGLAISKRLAEMLGGDINVQSEIGKGSTFTVAVDVGDLSSARWIHGLTEGVFVTPSEKTAAHDCVLRGRILLAEDGRDNQRLISTHLRKAGAEVVVAENGRDAVELVKSQSFDLVLMDMQMPVLDGYDATRQIRTLGFTLPILALTAHAMSGDREKCIAAGCTDYLTKPIDKSQLIWTLATHLGDKTVASTALATPSKSTATSDEPLKSEFANDADMRELVEHFTRELPQQVAKINTRLQRQEMDDLRRIVHQLKGAGGGYGFQPITHEAARAEDLIQHNHSLEEIDRAVRSLIDTIRRVEGYQPSQEDASCLKKS